MNGQQLGSVIGAVFGLIYVLVNAGPLPTAASLPLRIAGVLAFLLVLAAVYRARGQHTAEQTGGFGRGYWLVVAGEAAALAAGLGVLNIVLHTPQAGVAWVSVVVGVHFFALAAVFHRRFFHVLGGAITACGLAGLVLVGTGIGQESVAVIGGIVPGAILLGFGWWGARSAPPEDTYRTTLDP